MKRRFLALSTRISEVIPDRSVSIVAALACILFSSFALAQSKLSANEISVSGMDATTRAKAVLQKPDFTMPELLGLYEKRIETPLSKSHQLRRDFRRDQVRGGGQESGGGNVVSFREGCAPILLDSVYLDSGLSESSDTCFPYSVSEQDTAQAISTRALTPLDQADLEVIEIAIKKLSRAKSAFNGNSQFISAELLTLLESSLRSTTYVKINRELKLNRSFEWPNNLTRQEPIRVETAILFLDRFGAVISTPVWTKLGTQTKVGLLIHEAFRQIQNQYGLHDILDRQIQFLTALILSERLESNVSLEPFMSRSLYQSCQMRVLAKQSSIRSAIGKILSQREEQFNQMLSRNQAASMSRAIVNAGSDEQAELMDLLEKYAK